MQESFPLVNKNNEGSPEQEQYALFERMISQPAVFQVGEAEVPVFDLRPEIVVSDTPVLFVPGYAKTAVSYKETLFELYKAGKRIISVSAPVADLNLELPDADYPKPQLERALVINNVLTQMGIEQVDLVSHSEGGMNAMIAAAQNPDVFRHFLFVAPPGITEMQSYLTIIKRWTVGRMRSGVEKFSQTDIEKERVARFNAEAREFVTNRGVMKGALESMEPGRVDVSDLMRELHMAGHGVSVIAGADDLMLPMQEFQRNVTGAARSAESYGLDGFYSVRKGHDEIEVHGEDFGQLVNYALDALVAKYHIE